MAVVCVCVPLAVENPLAAEVKVRPEPVFVNLVNPCGVAIQPKTGYVFVASRFGVYCYDPNYKKVREHRAVVEIDGYPEQAGFLGSNPKYEVAPLGLAFMDEDHLVVGGGSRKPGEELVRVYRIPAKLPGPSDWIKEQAAVYTLGPIKAGKDSTKGEGSFYGVAVGQSAIWITCQGDDSKGWVAKSEIENGKPDPFKLTIATVTAAQAGRPGPITFTPDGKELVVGQMGDTASDAADSVLAFYDPADGSLKRKLKIELRDVSGLAYSPKTHMLYATDFAWKAPHEGGLFSLAIDGESVKTTKVAALDKPTALAFDNPRGHLYVTIIGTPDKSKGTDPGALIYFKPGL